MDENYEKQLEAYNNLLLARMVPEVIKKRTEKEKAKQDKEAIALNKKCDVKQDEHVKTQKRLLDVESLSQLTTECDNTSLDLSKSLRLLAKYNLKETLVKLKSNLNALMVLQTKNIILPESEKEIARFLNIIQSCFERWKSIDISKFVDTSKTVQSNMNSYSGVVESLDSTIQELINTVSELQLLVLKHTSETLTNLQE